jgi:hypothetical protein
LTISELQSAPVTYSDWWNYKPAPPSRPARKEQTIDSRELAEQHFAKHKDEPQAPALRLTAICRAVASDFPAVVGRQIGVWTKPLARRTLRISLARSAG